MTLSMTTTELYKLLIGKEGKDAQEEKLFIATTKVIAELKTARQLVESGDYMAYSIAVLEECLRTYKQAYHIGHKVAYWRMAVRTGYKSVILRLTNKK